MFNRIVRHISFPLIAKRHGLSHLYARMDQLEKSQYWSLERLKELQLLKLRKLLTYAGTHVPYYRDVFRDLDFTPEAISSVEDLECIPLLNKQIIRQQEERLVSTSLTQNKLHFSETGGTTGIKMKFYRDNACLTVKEALRFRFERWAGWEIGDSMALVWPATVDYVGHHTLKAKLKNALYERQVVFPAAVLDQKSIEDFLARARKNKIIFIRAFSSPLYEIAQYMIDAGKRLPVKGIVTTGEPLFPHQRSAIEKAFECAVLDSYRCREIGPVAQQCREGGGMHINMESVVVEVVDRDKENGQQGNIVVTDLENYGMPLIRYSIDDLGELSEEGCRCGRSLQMLKTLSGRTLDSLVAPDGRRIMTGSLVLYLVDEAPGMVGQVQVVQDRIDHLFVRMTPNPPPTEEIRAYQLAKIRDLFGASMQVDFEIVPEIPRSKSGKYQFALNQIDLKDPEA